MDRWINTFLFFIFSLSIATAKPEWIAVIDAGSSGSRLHVYEYDRKIKPLQVKEIFSKKTNPGISFFAKQPKTAYASLSPLFTAAEKQIKSKKISTKIPTYLYATAGMRLLTDNQQKFIYEALQQDAKKQKTFNLTEAKTISGEEEGFFAWISVNHLLNKLSTDKTVGVLDLGGASTQIAFTLTENQANNYPHLTYTVENKKHFVFSKTYLGLGVVEASKGMNNDPACRPPSSLLNQVAGNFNLKICRDKIQQWIIPKTQLALPAIQLTDSFAGISVYAEAAHFFHVDKNFTPGDLIQKTNLACKDNATQKNQKDLSMMCFDGVYAGQLLQDLGFSEHSQEIKIYQPIEKQEMAWSLGAAFYVLSQPSPHSAVTAT